MGALNLSLQKFIINNRLINFLFIYLLGLNKIIRRGRNNKLLVFKSLIKFSEINVKGSLNEITMSYNTKLYNSKIHINGKNNKVIIRSNVYLDGIDIRLWGHNNLLVIGEKTTFNTDCKISIFEGTKLIIGDGCMFSYNVDIRTSDGHPIYQNKKRINMASDISIGNNVWVGSHVVITKGSKVSNGSIIGTKSLVNKSYLHENSLLVGSPAKVINKEVIWERDF